QADRPVPLVPAGPAHPLTAGPAAGDPAQPGAVDDEQDGGGQRRARLRLVAGDAVPDPGQPHRGPRVAGSRPLLAPWPAWSPRSLTWRRPRRWAGGRLRKTAWAAGRCDRVGPPLVHRA